MDVKKNGGKNSMATKDDLYFFKKYKIFNRKCNPSLSLIPSLWQIYDSVAIMML